MMVIDADDDDDEDDEDDEDDDGDDDDDADDDDDDDDGREDDDDDDDGREDDEDDEVDAGGGTGGSCTTLWKIENIYSKDTTHVDPLEFATWPLLSRFVSDQLRC